ncbi:hypothetical protein N665_0445s0061 [Sinapis alba]|nr:hypothetical protein N665_0445s0061 [Sinapis alba]
MAGINLDGLRWRVFDAKAQVLGRLASQISTVLQAKAKPTYCPNRDDGHICIVLNAKDIGITGRKLTDKFYRWLRWTPEITQSERSDGQRPHRGQRSEPEDPFGDKPLFLMPPLYSERDATAHKTCNDPCPEEGRAGRKWWNRG